MVGLDCLPTLREDIFVVPFYPDHKNGLKK